MSDLRQYAVLKKRVEQAQQEASQAEGALGQVMKQLKTEFGCTTFEAAKAKLKTLKKQGEVVEKKFDAALEAFKDKWSEKGDPLLKEWLDELG